MKLIVEVRIETGEYTRVIKYIRSLTLASSDNWKGLRAYALRVETLLLEAFK